jgi:hypothetical protein
MLSFKSKAIGGYVIKDGNNFSMTAECIFDVNFCLFEGENV